MPRVAAAWAELMAGLGYERYVVQGGDFGAWISLVLAGIDHEHVIGAHVNFLPTPPSGDPADLAGLTEVEGNRLRLLMNYVEDQSGYMKRLGQGSRGGDRP
ncbi:alpha/beta fold hydrolase [Micromonospora sp. DT43]|uniref:alpha/beta fold hydrolase n=1 Tax=Micromonospora sp. DT43 TaxID=3393440 RepID=UPI003CF2DB64